MLVGLLLLLLTSLLSPSFSVQLTLGSPVPTIKEDEFLTKHHELMEKQGKVNGDVKGKANGEA